MLFSLPEGMKLGVAMSALQVEGGRTDSAWEAFSSGHVKDGALPQDCGAHFERMRADMALLKALNVGCYRMSVSWARVVPQENLVDEGALAHYRTEFALARAYGIEPIVTLHHFDEPLWFARRGGFLQPEALRHYLFFVSSVARALRGICQYFITFNEPNVYALQGYLLGAWPPEKRSLHAPQRALHEMARCHRAAYRCLHLIIPDAMVGIAPHVRDFWPGASPAHRLCTKRLEKWYQLNITERFIAGDPPLADFCALNYYARSTLGSLRGAPRGRPVSDLGWEIAPEGLKTLCESSHSFVLPPRRAFAYP